MNFEHELSISATGEANLENSVQNEEDYDIHRRVN